MPQTRRFIRNPVARSPLLRKGGAHQKSRSAERHSQHQALQAELDAWWEQDNDLDWQWFQNEPLPTGSW